MKQQSIASRILLLLMLLSLSFHHAISQSHGSTAKQSADELGRGAVFNPPQVVWGRMQEECSGPSLVNCVIRIMRQTGASAQAIKFTRLIDGDGYMDSFREMGKVDLATAFFPFRANTNGGTFLVNGSPSLIAVEELDKWGKIDIRTDPLYQSIARRFSEVMLWGGEPAFERMQRLPSGGQRFVFAYVLLNGCHACDVAGSAHVGFDFDLQGKLLGTRLLRLTGATKTRQHHAAIAAQEAKRPLTNADVIEMSKAGLPERTIILAVQKGPAQFDTSPQALIQLKNQGVSPAVLDAMLQPGSGTAASSQTTPVVRQTNNLDPLASGSNAAVSSVGGVYLVDGAQRTPMKYSATDGRSNSMLPGVVNPFHKVRMRAALSGNHAQSRTRNTAPVFELSLAADANPIDRVVIVKLKAKSDTREIETSRGGLTGGSSGFRKEDCLPVTLEEITGTALPGQKLYRLKLINPLVPGEYALVYWGVLYYDFGVDSN